MAKLVECKSCKHTVDPSAKTCPSCGVSKPGNKGTARRWVFIGLFIFIIMSGLIKGPHKPDETVKAEQAILAVAAENNLQKPEAAAKAERPSATPPEIKGGTAQEYKIISTQDLSNGYRKRHRWFIVSEAAKTFEDRAATVIKAAIDLKKQTRTQEAFILMDISKEFSGHGDVIAMADYVYDSKDEPWKVQSSDVVVTKPLNKNAMPFILLKDAK